jgi:hypothetical protein
MVPRRIKHRDPSGRTRVWRNGRSGQERPSASAAVDSLFAGSNEGDADMSTDTTATVNDDITQVDGAVSRVDDAFLPEDDDSTLADDGAQDESSTAIPPPKVQGRGDGPERTWKGVLAYLERGKRHHGFRRILTDDEPRRAYYRVPMYFGDFLLEATGMKYTPHYVRLLLEMGLIRRSRPGGRKQWQVYHETWDGTPLDPPGQAPSSDSGDSLTAGDESAADATECSIDDRPILEQLLGAVDGFHRTRIVLDAVRKGVKESGHDQDRVLADLRGEIQAADDACVERWLEADAAAEAAMAMMEREEGVAAWLNAAAGAVNRVADADAEHQMLLFQAPLVE